MVVHSRRHSGCRTRTGCHSLLARFSRQGRCEGPFSLWLRDGASSHPEEVCRKSVEDRFYLPSFADITAGSNTLHSKVNYRQIRVGLIDPKTWLGGLIIGPIAASVTALVVFLPTFVHEFGISARKSSFIRSGMIIYNIQ